MGKSSKAPASPDPYQVSNAQTQSNQQTAAYNARLDRYNTYTPFGSREYGLRGTDPVTGAPIYEEEIRLSPEQQALYSQGVRRDLNTGAIGESMFPRLAQTYSQPMSTAGLPEMQGAPQMQGYQNQLNMQGPELRGQLDTSGLPQLYGDGDLNTMRGNAESALYDRNTAYLDPQMQRDEASLRSRLANQGVVEGSEAYRNAMSDFNQSKEMAYRQARNESIAGAGSEAQRLFGLSSAARDQMFGEQQAGGQFQNDARAQALAEALGSGSFANQAAAAGNQDALAAAGFDNYARGQGLQERAYLRNQPLEELRALTGSTQVQTPQFNATGQVGAAPTDVAGNVWNAYNGQVQNANARTASNNSFMSGLFGLGAAAMPFLLSDKRAKTDIRKIGKLPSDVNMYSFRYKGDPTRRVGAIAQDVEKKQPGAVVTKNGLKHVNYQAVLAKALRAA